MTDKTFHDIVPQTRPGRWYLKMRVALTKSRLRFFKYLDQFFRKWALLLNKQIGDQTNDVEEVDKEVNKIVAHWDALGLPGPPPGEGTNKATDDPEQQQEQDNAQDLTSQTTKSQAITAQNVATSTALRRQQLDVDDTSGFTDSDTDTSTDTAEDQTEDQRPVEDVPLQNAASSATTSAAELALSEKEQAGTENAEVTEATEKETTIATTQQTAERLQRLEMQAVADHDAVLETLQKAQEAGLVNEEQDLDALSPVQAMELLNKVQESRGR